MNRKKYIKSRIAEKISFESDKQFEFEDMPNKLSKVDMYFKKEKVAVILDEFKNVGDTNLRKILNYNPKHFQEIRINVFKSNGITLLVSREDEWKNNSDIIISKILRELKLEKVIDFYFVEEIQKDVAKEFLEYNHLQGFYNSKMYFGAFFDNELYAVMAVQKARDSMRTKDEKYNDTLEIVRYCNKIGYYVENGLTVMIETLRVNYNPKTIKVFADIRWNDDKSDIELAGFELERISDKGYRYIKDGITYSRIKFQKHKLSKILKIFDPNLSESINMKNNGYDRYWDCGQLVYYYHNKEYKGDN